MFDEKDSNIVRNVKLFDFNRNFGGETIFFDIRKLMEDLTKKYDVVEWYVHKDNTDLFQG